MPGLIEHIGAIARKKQRAVLYPEFHPKPYREWRGYSFQDDAVRCMILAWLDEHGVPWKTCGPFCDPLVMTPYRGQVSLDVPYDESPAEYRKLRDYLEYPDGSMRQEGVPFHAMTLEHAMQNADRDEPGYWEPWVEQF